MRALSELVSGLDQEMERLGYAPPTMRWYRGAWLRMERYFEVRGEQEFSLDLGLAWLEDACGYSAREKAGTLRQSDGSLFRVVQMLQEYAVHGTVLRRYRQLSSLETGPAAEVIARFRDHLRGQRLSARTVDAYGVEAGEFVTFTGSRGGLACCDAAMIGAFVATLAGYQAKTTERKLVSVRSFLRFATAAGLVDAACLEAVPTVRSMKKARIRSVWAPGQVAAIVAAIDRDNPAGKRDYAIILLIARLGLRGVDVRRLEFSDLDWASRKIAVTQAKTGRKVWLPLLTDVGWAVIDYIQHGRPACDCPQVFVRHVTPVGPFSDDDHLHQILVKHARVAHVPVSEDRRHGMHSLRHTLATRLMEAGTPVEQIAEILGQRSVDSAAVYLQTSVGLLRKCALDPDEPARTGQEAAR